MAPEQLRDQPVSPATDLYAAGILILSLALGRFPFPEEPEALFASKQAGELPWNELRGCSEWSRDLLRRLVDLDPSRRLTVAETLAKAEPTLPIELQLATSPAFLESHPMVAPLREQLSAETHSLVLLTAPHGSGKKSILQQLLQEESASCEWRLLPKIDSARGLFDALAQLIRELELPVPAGPVSDLLIGKHQPEEYAVLAYAALALLQRHFPDRTFVLLIEDTIEAAAESAELRQLFDRVLPQLELKLFWLRTAAPAGEGIALPVPEKPFFAAMLGAGTHVTPAGEPILADLLKICSSHLQHLWQLFRLNVDEKSLVLEPDGWRWRSKPRQLATLVDFYRRVLEALTPQELRALAIIGSQAPGITARQQDEFLAATGLSDHLAPLHLKSLLKRDPHAGLRPASELIRAELSPELHVSAHSDWYDWLRKRYPDAIGALAHHLIAIGIEEAEADAALSLAERLIKTVNYDLAGVLLDRLEELAVSEQQSTILELKFNIALDRGELPTARKLVERSLSFERTQKHIDRLIHLTTLMEGPAAGLEVLQRDLEPLIGDDTNSRFRFLSRLAYQYLLLGEIDKVTRTLEEAETKKADLEWRSDLVSPMNTLATVYYHLQKLEPAGEIWEQLLSTDALTSNQDLLFRNNLAVIRIRTGREREALELLTQVAGQAREHHLVVLEQQSGTNMALLALHQGQVEEALTALHRCLQLAELIGNREMICNSRHNLAEAMIAAGQIETACAQLAAALPPEAELTIDHAETLLLQAKVLLAFERDAEARTRLEQTRCL